MVGYGLCSGVPVVRRERSVTRPRFRSDAAVDGPEAARPIPVLILIDSLDGGGAERYVVDLASALRAQGWPVEVACSTAGVRADALAQAGVPVSVLVGELVKRRVSGRYGRALRRLILERRPAVVHAHLYASAAAAVQATRGLSVPVVVTEHTEAPWRGRRARTVSRLVYQRVDHVVAVSSSIRDVLVGEYDVPVERVEVLRPAAATSAAEADVPARHVAGPRAPVVGLVGRLVPEKGVDVFLQAASLVTSVVPHARFVVVGEGPLRADLERRAATLGLGETVTFTGFRADARQRIAGLDVLAVPSRSEGSPLVVCEAMAAGIPVVASRVGGLPDMVQDGANGLLVPPGEVEDLARALVSLLLDETGAQKLGARGRELAATWSHARLVDRMTEIYSALARGTVEAAPSSAGRWSGQHDQS
jgi:glycosyltransferase involved in cell wall biosynthesis